MNRDKSVTILVLLILLIAVAATILGIFTSSGSGTYEYETIRGKIIEIYGQGLYRHMSADVAIQGIAQDYITLFLALPLLLLSFMGYRKGSVRAHLVLCGVLGYFLVTYLFYTAMAMYNEMYLAYVALLGLSFYGLLITLKPLLSVDWTERFSSKTPRKFAGWFLIINAIMIASLWLQVVLPPLFDGSIYPPDLNHYTTLIVQGFDLGLLLPASFISGFLLLKKRSGGYLAATIYLVFLSVLMTALSAKIIAMAAHGAEVIPVIFIIPTINIITIICSVLMVRGIKA